MQKLDLDALHNVSGGAGRGGNNNGSTGQGNITIQGNGNYVNAYNTQNTSQSSGSSKKS